MGFLQTHKVKRKMTEPLKEPTVVLVSVPEAVNIEGKKGRHDVTENDRTNQQN